MSLAVSGTPCPVSPDCPVSWSSLPAPVYFPNGLQLSSPPWLVCNSW